MKVLDCVELNCIHVHVDRVALIMLLVIRIGPMFVVICIFLVSKFEFFKT